MAIKITRGFNELATDVVSRKLIPGLIQGLIISALIVVIEVSFANVIFTGPLASYANQAAGICIFGGAGFCLVTGLFSSFPSLVSLPQDASVAILSVVSIAIMTALPHVHPDVWFATVVAAMIVSSLLTALVFALVGKFRLANFARFLPYPVIGGFLAGSGVLLAFGGLSIMTDTALSLASLPDYMSPRFLFHWLPGVGFAFCVWLWIRLRPHFLIFPLGILTAMIVFYLLVAVSGVELAVLRSQGWLAQAVNSETLWPVVSSDTFSMVDFDTLLGQLPSIFTVALMALIGMVFNVSGIELGVQQDIDLDRELRVEAVANLVSGLGGGFAGYATLSLSLLGPKCKISTRIIPVTVGIICLLIIFYGGQLITFIPKPLLGGMVFLIGLFFIDDWIFSGWKRLAMTDYCIVLAIVFTITTQGFLPGVLLGLGLTSLIFIFRFTRIPIIRSETNLTNLHSAREYSVPEKVLLRRDGERSAIFSLSGYLFFGSSYFVGQRVKALLEQELSPQQLIFDLSAIQGFDVSAVNTFMRIAQQTASKQIQMYVAAASDQFVDQLKRNAEGEILQNVGTYPNLDRALEAAEGQLLAKHRRLLDDSVAGLAARDNLFVAAADELDAQLRQQEQFETMLEQLAAYTQQRSVVAEEFLFTAGHPQQLVRFVVWGSVALQVTDAAGGLHRTTSVGPGGVVAAQAAWGDWLPRYSARVEQQGFIAEISREMIIRMEAEQPELALSLYKYLAMKLGEGAT